MTAYPPSQIIDPPAYVAPEPIKIWRLMSPLRLHASWRPLQLLLTCARLVVLSPRRWRVTGTRKWPASRTS